MTARKTRHTYWLIIGLCLVSALPIGKGCKRDSNNSSPAGPSAKAPTLSLKLADNSELQAKSVGLMIEAAGLDQNGNPTNDVAAPLTISNPIFPLDVDLTVFTPPCCWRMTITVNLSRDPARRKSIEFDACAVSSLNLNVDTFEEMQIPDTEGPIYAPSFVIAGAAAEVRCEPLEISAPDSTPVATLQEQGGQSVSGSIGTNASVSKSFPDPYPVVLSSSEARIFTCTIGDGHSPARTFQQTIQRILPTPTPGPGTPTAMPTSGPGTPTATPTSGLGTPTATPTSGPGTPTATPTITPTAAPAATSTPTQTPLPDTDSDGVPDASDNCPTVPNPHQISTDTDTSCRLIDNNDGTVADMDNGLMWERTPNNSWVNWATALTTCNSSTVAGYGDWRLPSVNDYRQLTGGTLVCSACPCPGPTCPWDWFLPAGHPFQSVGLFYWSSSGPSDPIDPAPAGYALGVDFPGGYVDADGQTFSVAVWCVRN